MDAETPFGGRRRQLFPALSGGTHKARPKTQGANPLTVQVESRPRGAEKKTVSSPYGWLCSLSCVLLIFAIYSVLHITFRIAASPNISQDDVSAMLFTQHLSLGYTPRQPPLYDWMLWTVQQVTGPTVSSFLFLKYSLLIASAGFIYSGALRVFSSTLWATLSALSLLLLYQIGWNIHEGVTHTSAMICAIAASFWAFTRLVEKERLADYLILGLCIGLGSLTKYSYGAFVVSFFGAALLQPATRRLILNRQFLATIAIAIGISLPFVGWVLFNEHDLATVYASSLQIGAEGHWARASRGVFLALRSSFSFLLPLLFLVPLIFPGALKAAREEFGEAMRPSHELDWEKLLLHMTLISLALLLAAAVVAGASDLRMRYMHPFYLLTPLWLIAMARRGMTRPNQPLIFVSFSLIFALAVLILRGGYLIIGEPPFCEKCRHMTPYDALAQTIRDKGFRSGTIIAGYRHTAGNMRARFPDDRVVVLRRPRVVPPIRPGDRQGQIVLIWEVQSEGPNLPWGAEEQVASLGGRIDAEPETIQIPWTHAWRKTGYRQTEWKLIVIDPTRQ